MFTISEGFTRGLLVFVLVLMFTIIGVRWTAATEPTAEEVTEANNPIASVVAFNIQN